MSGYNDFYRNRILISANIPQIEEGSIVGYITLYAISPGVLVMSAAAPSVAPADATVIEEAPVTIDLTLDVTPAICQVSKSTTP